MATITISVDNYHSMYIAKSGSNVTQVTGIALVKNKEQSVCQYSLDLTDVSCVYVAAWSDRSGRQGVLAEIAGWFKPKILTGGSEWEVFPTKCFPTKQVAGKFLSPETVQTQIDKATWTNPSVGPNNTKSKGSTFAFVKDCDSSAKWIWFDKGNGHREKLPPFTPGWDHGEYLLFRVQAPPESHGNVRFL